MKHISILVFVLFLGWTSNAQDIVEVVTGPSYENDVYYSLADQSMHTVARNNWDLGFSSAQFDVNIIANHSSGVEVYVYPDGDITAWETLDVSGMGGWTPVYNSIDDLYEGAFLRNINPNDPFDFGWGKYNPASHVITGDSLYVVKTVGGATKKLWIVEKNPLNGINKWEVKFANVDGSNEETFMIECDPYAAKNFVYYSLDNNELIDREPVAENWDLEFTKYYDYNIPYVVSGIANNAGRVLSYEVDGVEQDSYEDYDEMLFNDTLTTIGSDWKSFNGSAFQVDENRVFFIKTYDNQFSDSTYWKLYFIGFTGSSEGKYTFVQKQLGSSDVVNFPELAVFDVYPNPAKDHLFVITDSSEEIKLSIIDISGKIIQNDIKRSTGFSKTKIEVGDLTDGVYMLVAKGKHGIVSRKFIKK